MVNINIYIYIKYTYIHILPIICMSMYVINNPRYKYIIKRMYGKIYSTLFPPGFNLLEQWVEKKVTHVTHDVTINEWWYITKSITTEMHIFYAS